MRAVGGTDELQVAIDKFEAEKGKSETEVKLKIETEGVNINPNSHKNSSVSPAATNLYIQQAIHAHTSLKGLEKDHGWIFKL
ncbi:hypothetical protein ACET3Z_032776 [Daucus carota]